MQISLSNRRISILIIFWIAVCVSILWWFEYRYWSNWQQQLVLFSDEQIGALRGLLPDRGKVTVMHIRSENCPCTDYQDAHIEELQSTLKKTTQVTIGQDQRRSIMLTLAAPSVAIWDQFGNLAYIGPYSAGAVCGQGEGFVERVLQQLATGHNLRWTNTQGVGCFCRDQFDAGSSLE